MRGGPRRAVAKGTAGGEGPGKARCPHRLEQRAAAPLGGCNDPTMAPLRMFDCAHYDDCLDEAVRGAWTSWTCDGCQAFEAASGERLAHDVAGLLQIWAEATGESVIDGPGVSGARPRHTGRGLPR